MEEQRLWIDIRVNFNVYFVKQLLCACILIMVIWLKNTIPKKNSRILYTGLMQVYW
jgi:hypothetical protein